MDNFNFNIKKGTYEASIKHAQTLLQSDDLENGVLYLNKAISLCEELINHCIINEVKQAYLQQLNQLKKLKMNIETKGINPFVQKKTIKVNNVQQDDKKDDEKENKLHFFKTESPDVTLKDIAGLEDVKEQIRLNVIAPLNNSDIYYKYTDNVGCQILMYGPPGCGKSFIAEAIAGELKCAYAIINTFDILDKYVGEAPKKIKQIFDEANQFDNCLIFFDELDALFASRESDDSSHTKDVLTAFLTCLSGFKTNSNKKIRVVIGATNRPWIIDSALLRGKRLDTHLYVGLPDEEARRFLVAKEFKNRMNLLENTDISIDTLVSLLDGYSGADISSIVNKIKLLALRRALNDSENGVNKEEPITLDDANKVISSYRNSITKESLEAFEAFKNGEI